MVKNNVGIKNILLALLILTGYFPPTSMAHDPESEKITLAAEWSAKYKNLCEPERHLTSPRIFPKTFKEAIAIRKTICQPNSASVRELQSRTISLLSELNRLFPDTSFVADLQAKEWERAKESGQVALFDLDDDPDLEITLEGTTISIVSSILDSCNAIARSIDATCNCYSALEEFQEYYNLAQSTIYKPMAFELADKLGDLEKEWENYYDKSRSQTLIELAFNGWLFQKENREHEFLPPPERQFIILHPSLVLENVNKADDGDQAREALMLEGFGINWWRQDKWYFPSGASLVALYSDRAGSDDLAFGLAVHVRSKLTIGAVNHDGKTGLFFTLDMLKLIQEKKSTFERIRGKSEF